MVTLHYWWWLKNVYLILWEIKKFQKYSHSTSGRRPLPLFSPFPCLRVMPWRTTHSCTLPEPQHFRFAFLLEDVLSHLGEVKLPAQETPGNTLPKRLKHPTTLNRCSCVLSRNSGPNQWQFWRSTITFANHPKCTLFGQKSTRFLVSEIHYLALTVLSHCHDWKTDSSETVRSSQCKKYYSSEDFTEPPCVRLYWIHGIYSPESKCP